MRRLRLRSVATAILLLLVIAALIALACSSVTVPGALAGPRGELLSRR